MKALLFNHHPDNANEIWTLLKELKIETHMATEAATKRAGAHASSTVGPDNLFQFITNFVKPEVLYPEMKDAIFSDDLNGYDYYITSDFNIAYNLNVKGLIYNPLIQPHLKTYNSDKFLKITSVQHAAMYNAKYLPYFVPQRGVIGENKTFITQLISDFRNVKFTNELINLKKKYNVIVAGSTDAPDGIVNDWDILQKTALLAHEKQWGTNCNAVCKALDSGVPVYMSRATKKIIGFDDLPDFMFIYCDHYDIETAYKIALEKDQSQIQKAFRMLRNKDLSKIYMYDILSSI